MHNTSSIIIEMMAMRTVISKAKHCKEKVTKGVQSAFKVIDKAHW
ncbi:MAG: hypothetical protein ACTJLL_02225 [Anaplasma sp.]